MSDLRINFFEGENELFYADLSCGYREQNFAYDGISTNRVECGVLGIVLKTENSYSAICVNLSINGNQSEYVLERSPFENKFMVDLGKIVSHDSEISLTLKNNTQKCSLVCSSKEWKIQYTDALKIATNNLQSDLEKLYFNGNFNAEGYLKVVNKYDYKQKFWFFSYIDRAKNSKNILIDVNNGKITKNDSKD